MVRLEGPRLVLREWRLEELDAMHAWLGDPEVTRFLSFGAGSREESRAHLELCVGEQARPDREHYFLAVEQRDTSEVLGSSGCQWRSRKYGGGEGDVGWFLRTPFWGCGFGTEAARLVVDFCFETLGMHKASASCDAGNVASERVMQKCGMTLEGELRHAHRRFGEWRNRRLYGVLRPEWERTRSKTRSSRSAPQKSSPSTT